MDIREKFFDFLSYFNPFEDRFHSADSFAKLSGFEKAGTIFFTVVGAVFGLGIGGLAAFRFCARKLSPEDQKTQAVAKGILQSQRDTIQKGEWEKLAAVWNQSVGAKGVVRHRDLVAALSDLKVERDVSAELKAQIDIVEEAAKSYTKNATISFLKHLENSERNSPVRKFQEALTWGDKRLFHEAITAAEKLGLMPRELLQEASLTLSHDPVAHDFLKRIIASYDVIVSYGPDKAKLTAFEMLRISAIAENALKKGGTENLRLKKGATGLERSLLIDFKNKNFTIIQGTRGPIDARGAWGKVRSTIEVSIEKIGDVYRAREKEVIDTVRKTLFLQPGALDRKFQKGEIDYEKEYGGLRTQVLYLQKGIQKETITFKAFPYTLGRYIQEKGFTHKELYAVMDGVTATLERMHHNDVVHLDIKSENILFNPPAGVKLADFGYTKKSVAGDPIEKHATPLCLSPEVVTGEEIPKDPKYQKAQDMFGLGVTLYHCITRNEIPWQGPLTYFYYYGKNPSSLIRTEMRLALAALDPNHPFTSLAKRLLDPDMYTRMTIDECRQELKKIQSSLNKSPP